MYVPLSLAVPVLLLRYIEVLLNDGSEYGVMVIALALALAVRPLLSVTITEKEADVPLNAPVVYDVSVVFAIVLPLRR